MADITLRAYVKEIDDLIEREKLDEAIAHCRHILQIYPKHLSTYRLLGKAYLEAKRYGDAADIFQRVLSAVPDDFVSHVGMAIVREDEGNLDAAIWHMERAFETNPANPAIRQELSRLIGRRDGLEPHKVRLTRGALARQYARGELFPQAISELRSALQEDPDRPDLEVLLASMYWRAGQAKEAKSVCEQILEKLPFSLEANRILSDLLEKEGQSQRSGELHRKLAALDPYIGFLESVDLEPDKVDPNAVRIDHSTWTPGEPLPTAEPGPPEWVTSLGVDLSSEKSDAVSSSPKPAWLSDLDQSPGSGRSSTSPLIEPAFDSGEFEGGLQDEDAIPEWMREAGWGPSTGEVEEGPVSFSDAELDALNSGEVPLPQTPADDDELAPADIPSWLQDIAPAPGEEPQAQEAEPEPAPLPPTEPLDGGLVPDWLSGSDGQVEPPTSEPVIPETEAIVQGEEGFDRETGENVEGPEVPTWIDSQAPGATSTIITWLGDRDGEGTDDEDALDDLAAAFGGGDRTDLDDFPSWLQETSETPAAEETGSDEAEIEGPPSWLAGVAEAASSMPANLPPDKLSPGPSSEESASTYSETDTSGETEKWIRRLAEQEQIAAAATEPERSLDWLSSIGGDESLDVAPSEPPPAWLSGSEPEQPVRSPSSAELESKTPDWLDGVEEVPAEEPIEQADVPEWLMGIADGTGSGPLEPVTDSVETDGTGEFSSDWLSDFASEEGEPGGGLVQAPVGLDALSETGISDIQDADQHPGELIQPPTSGKDLDDDEVFQWLESLAERQVGATSELGEEPHKAKQEPAGSVPYTDQAPPDAPDESLRWLEDLAAQRGIDVDVEAATPAYPAQEPAPGLSETESPVVEAPAPVEEKVEPEIIPEESPEWLREMAAADEAQAAAQAEISDAPQPAFSADLDETVVSQVGQPDTEATIPGWLDEAAAVAQDVPAEPSPPAVEPVEVIRETTPPPPMPDKVVVSETVAKTPVDVEEPPQIAKPPAASPAAEQKVEPVVEQQPVIVPPVISKEATPDRPEPAPVAEKKSEPEAVAPPPPIPVYKEPPTDAQMLLKSARQALAAGDAGRALVDYKKLIERKQDIETVIDDLKRALDRYPNLPTLWQALGDAYMKDDQLNEAIKAYQRGMEVA